MSRLAHVNVSFMHILRRLCVKYQRPDLNSNDEDDYLSQLAAYWLERLQRQTKDHYQFGLWLQPSSAANQLALLAQAFIATKSVDVVIIISASDAKEHAQWLIEQEWLELPLWVCPEHHFAHLHPLTLLFIQESNFAVAHQWPTDLIKIGLPHGSDISLKKTLTEYGGCLEFDYVLGTKPQPQIPLDSFSNRYPAALRQHSKAFTAEIPFGSVKFDAFYHRRQQCKMADTALIYHVSNLALEWTWVTLQLQPTIELLLANFPDYDVVFRPFPADVTHPAVEECRKRFADQPRFVFSIAPSYVDDYCKGAVMVCHRVYSDHLFPAVTGRSQIVYQPVAPRDENAAIITQSATLISRLQWELEKINSRSDKVAKTVDVYNPGRAVQYLMENLRYILTDVQHPDWRYFALDGEANVDTVLQQAVEGALAFNQLALAAVRQAPDRLDYQLLALESLSRVPTQLQHSTLAVLYWRKAMAMAAKLLRCQGLQNKVCRSLDSWMYQRGLAVLQQLLRLLQSQALAPNDDEKLLLDYYQAATYQQWPQRRPFTVVAVNSGNELAGGEVILYGAGQLALEFIAEQYSRQQYQVAAVVDSAQSKWQQQLAGINIQSPQMLTQSEAPVVICSRAFVEEIRAQLQQLPALAHRLYQIL